MLYLLANLRECFGPLRLFEYVTFRSGGALITSMLLVIFLGPWTIRRLKKFCVPKSARLEGLVAEQFVDHSKDKTPTMGGLLIIFSIVFSTIFWGDLSNRMVLVFLLVLLPLTALGFYDDYIKVKYERSVRDGVSGKVKLLIQILVSFVALYIIYKMPDTMTTKFLIPFFKDPICLKPAGETIQFWLPPQLLPDPLFTFPASWAFLAVGLIFLANILLVTFFSNAVNLTDGKDGLAAGCTIFCVLSFAAVAYVHGHTVFAKYLSVPYIPELGEISVFASAMAGACIGFLWYNCKPAAVFMGDTGSLPLGGSIGLIAVLMGQQFLLIVIGFVFLMEGVSVMIQVASFRLTGRRVFLCTPIHHHFEQKGWSETQIVIRFWIIAGICALIGLATLKLR
ncbi:MAG TPA: phospho-N-acetylmuramoyl-pentapeptide-transferase [Lentisphaeria bacterium]|jgi:phospho-N-acetylmuramoyl-pentapeptide-transferase|nr:phospho-N-acetylmuramoyl-pentapeptide-transferase [Lentisphaeria bacterium]HCG47879.1 phospho-N-acetylmuramoyl-pentapeptide-transferase [Lentisphaeria bacterium]